MPIEFNDNFNLCASIPIDPRIIASNTTQRNGIPTHSRYDGMEVFVLSDRTTYRWNETISAWNVNPTNPLLYGYNIPSDYAVMFDLNGMDTRLTRLPDGVYYTMNLTSSFISSSPPLLQKTGISNFTSSIESVDTLDTFYREHVYNPSGDTSSYYWRTIPVWNDIKIIPRFSKTREIKPSAFLFDVTSYWGTNSNKVNNSVIRPVFITPASFVPKVSDVVYDVESFYTNNLSTKIGINISNFLLGSTDNVYTDPNSGTTSVYNLTLNGYGLTGSTSVSPGFNIGIDIKTTLDIGSKRINHPRMHFDSTRGSQFNAYIGYNYYVDDSGTEKDIGISSVKRNAIRFHTNVSSFKDYLFNLGTEERIVLVGYTKKFGAKYNLYGTTLLPNKSSTYFYSGSEVKTVDTPDGSTWSMLSTNKSYLNENFTTATQSINTVAILNILQSGGVISLRQSKPSFITYSWYALNETRPFLWLRKTISYSSVDTLYKIENVDGFGPSIIMESINNNNYYSFGMIGNTIVSGYYVYRDFNFTSGTSSTGRFDFRFGATNSNMNSASQSYSVMSIFGSTSSGVLTTKVDFQKDLILAKTQSMIKINNISAPVNLNLSAGNSTISKGGTVSIIAGNGSTNGGNIYISTGTSSVSGNSGNIRFNQSGNGGVGIFGSIELEDNVIYIQNTTTEPTTPPNGQGFLYVKNGSLMFKDYNGNTQSIVALGPYVAPS